jgi:hypothetical protein
MVVVPKKVMPLHYVTLEYRLRVEDQKSQVSVTSGKHRFLYGVESWIDGLDQQLENLTEGESHELILEPESVPSAAALLLPEEELPELIGRFALEMRVVEVVKAEPIEVTKALAASVSCCDHCGNH